MSLAPPSASSVVTVAETGSTQRDLLEVADDAVGWPHLSGIRALRQTAGRGRGDRRWDTEGLTALTASLVLRPELPGSRWPWLPLLTGAAVVQSLAGLGATAALKWPNDVVLLATTPVDGWGRWRKVAGILAEALPGGAGVVVGIGVNVDGAPPVPWATTLSEHRVEVDAGSLLELIRLRLAQGLASDPAGWPDAVRRRCATLGTEVLVHLPGGERLQGVARDLDPSGGLVVEVAGRPRVVMAGDVEHLRTPPSGATPD